jgi:hypothetical protein
MGVVCPEFRTTYEATRKNWYTGAVASGQIPMTNRVALARDVGGLVPARVTLGFGPSAPIPMTRLSTPQSQRHPAVIQGFGGEILKPETRPAFLGEAE